MADPLGLRPEDRAEFEAVLHLALNTPDVRSALHADPTGRAALRLRVRALADTDRITAAAYSEYRTYLTCLALSASTEESTPRRPAGAGLVAALVALTPPVAASSAAVLFVLGYLLELTDARGTLPGSLVTAGWILALVAAVSTLIALAALLGTAIRGRGASAHTARLEQARLDWQQALLERGMLPHLRRYLSEDLHLGSAAPTTPSLDSAIADAKSGPPFTG
ncbi:hypothetical protein [Streptomyces phaeochromogenes]|uniref:hypothetical protein n=1 Tax=Streptomyces phaeochromogenes TaxID=1923 RepID=UPI00386720FE|nr:hypothetical protein OG277_34520 [Streptomyces phaeochromogenes]